MNITSPQFIALQRELRLKLKAFSNLNEELLSSENFHEGIFFDLTQPKARSPREETEAYFQRYGRLLSDFVGRPSLNKHISLNKNLILLCLEATSDLCFEV